MIPVRSTGAIFTAAPASPPSPHPHPIAASSERRLPQHGATFSADVTMTTFFVVHPGPGSSRRSLFPRFRCYETKTIRKMNCHQSPPPQTHTHTPQSRGRGRKSPVLCTPSPAGGTEGLRTTRRKTCTPADYCSVVSVSSAAVFPLASGISLAVRSRLVPGSGRRFKRPQTKPPPVNTTSLPGYPP